VRIGIVTPGAEGGTVGGAERAWAGLRGALEEAGHAASIVTVPVDESGFGPLLAGYRSAASLDTSAFDLVISSKYPVWIAPHPRHVLWMFHPLRGLYDTYHLFKAPLDPGPVEPATRTLLDLVRGPARRERVTEVLDAADAALAALGPDHPDLRLPGPTSRLVVHWLDRVALAPGEIARHTALSRTIAVRADYLPPRRRRPRRPRPVRRAPAPHHGRRSHAPVHHQPARRAEADRPGDRGHGPRAPERAAADRRHRARRGPGSAPSPPATTASASSAAWTTTSWAASTPRPWRCRSSPTTRTTG
jgi:hypothetical protein